MPKRSIFCGHLTDEQRAQLVDADGVEAALDAYLERGRVAHPQLVVEDELALAHLASHLPTDGLTLDTIAAMHAEDMYLACACSKGDGKAAVVFQREIGPAIRRAIGRVANVAVVDEMTQSVLAVLLAGEPPAVSKYGGRGRLDVWAQVLAGRHARRKLRRKRPDAPNQGDLLVDRASEAFDPELEALRQRYSAHFRTALEHGLGTLAPRDRNMLRHELVERLSLEKTAAQYGVHRATAARWRAASRKALLEAVRQYFRQQHGVTDDELDSIVRLIRSQLNLSISRMLAPPE